MSQAFSVFITYRGKDDTLCESVRAGLEKEKMIVHVDWNISSGADVALHKQLRGRLYESDLVIALLTEAARSSLEVHEELVTAWEWKIPILPVITKELLGFAPWFLRDAERVSWDLDQALGRGETHELVEDIVQRVQKFRERCTHYRTERETRRAIGRIASAVARCGQDQSPAAGVRLVNIKECTMAAANEAQLLTDQTGPYHQNLSVENNFLIRALPSFSSASRIYAVSLDNVSRFWGSEEQADNARSYLEKQRKECRRLFVFPDPRSAHRLRNVLAAHHRYYGSERAQEPPGRGGVFLCTNTCYFDEIIPNVVRDESRSRRAELQKRFQGEDFGVLEFKNNAGSEFHELSLSGSTFKRIVIGTNATGYVKRIIDMFDEWMHVIPGGSCLLSKHKVLRWTDQFATNDLQWVSALKQLFVVDDTESNIVPGRVIHIVFFHKSVPTSRLIEQLHLQAEKLELSRQTSEEDLYFAIHTEDLQSMVVQDGRFKGKLHLDPWLVERYPCALITPLKSVAHLISHYQSHYHSEAREAILRALDERIAKLYDRIKQTKDPREKEFLYQSVEDRASMLMLRVDLQEQQNIEMVVKAKPLDNGWHEMWNREHVPY